MAQHLSLVAWITVAILLMGVPGSVADQTPRQGSIGVLAVEHDAGERVPVYLHPGAGEDSFREWLAPGTRVHVVGQWTSKDEHWLLATREDEEVPRLCRVTYGFPKTQFVCQQTSWRTFPLCWIGAYGWWMSLPRVNRCN